MTQVPTTRRIFLVTDRRSVLLSKWQARQGHRSAFVPGSLRAIQHVAEPRRGRSLNEGCMAAETLHVRSTLINDPNSRNTPNVVWRGSPVIVPPAFRIGSASRSGY